jgi:hypothetical protein
LGAKEIEKTEGGFIWFLIAACAEYFDSDIQPDGELGGYLGCKL